MTSTAEKDYAFAYTIIPVTEEEIPALVDYANEIEALEPVDESFTLDEYVRWHNNPMNRNTEFIVREESGESRVIGNMSFGYVAEHERAWGWFGVHPDYRRRGLGTALYDRFIELAGEKGAKDMHLTPNTKQHLLVEFLEKRGWGLDRYFWDMRYDASQPLPQAAALEGLSIRSFVPGQDLPLWQHVRNATFADHFGSVPRTMEEIEYVANEPHFRPEALLFAFMGEEVAGFCFTAIDPSETERRGYSVGHVHNIGTMPEFRGKGVGRALLLAGMSYLQPQVSFIDLGVEGKNERALRLYESVGFERHKSWANMHMGREGR